MMLRCVTCDIQLESPGNPLSTRVCESLILGQIFIDCLQLQISSENDVVCDGCKVQLILFYQFKLKAVALQLKRIEKNKEIQNENSITGEVKYDEDKNEKEFICAHCSLPFMSRIKLKHHIFETHKEYLGCFQCTKKFKSVIKLRKHIESKHNEAKEEPKTFVCEICKKFLKSKLILKRHKANCHGIGTVRLAYKCEICNTSWPSKTGLETHIIIKHLNEKKFTCAICDKKFATKNILLSHVNRVHCLSRNFICTTCGKAFKTQQNLNSHILIHSKVKKFMCFECGASFRQEATLCTHMKSHREKSAGITYECQICKITFATARTLKKHEQSHTGPDLVCEHCSKIYKQKNSLNKHILSVHKNIRLRVACLLCSKILWNRNIMREHVQNEHADILKADSTKCIDDYLQNTQINEVERQNNGGMKIICVKILNK